MDVQAQTRCHYDSFPFDFLTKEDEENIELVQPAAFRSFVNQHLKPGMKVAEVGCGPGRSTMYLVQRGVDLLAVDISKESLRLAKRRAPEATFVEASNMDLPFASQSFDAVISDGVIHHTPDPIRCFDENARVLRSGGVLYVAVYRRKRYYYYVYNYLGPPIRWLEKRRWGKAIITTTLLPVYYLVHKFKSRGRRTWNGAKNFFYDYIITPRATFHTKEEIEGWGARCGLTLVEYFENIGNVHAFVFRKSVA